MTIALNKRARRVALTEKLITDENGKRSFESLQSELDKRGVTKRERYYAVLSLLKNLQSERRLWRPDGSVFE